MRKTLKRFFDLPAGVKTITLATGVRWAAWGLVDGLIPVFIFSFSDSFAESGLFRSVYDIVFILSLPIAGMLADQKKAKVLIVIGLIIYPLISLSYFFAGLFGMAVFLVIARALNGFNYALDSIGRQTYFMRNTPREMISRAFGYFDTFANLWPLVFALASLAVISFVDVTWLFLGILPTSLIALAIIGFRLKEEEPKPRGAAAEAKSRRPYYELIKESRSWDTGLKTIGLVTFFQGFIGVFGSFFIPIIVFLDGADLHKVVLVYIARMIPLMFGEFLGKLADKNRSRSLVGGFSALVVLFVSLIIFDHFVVQLIVALGIGIVSELITLTDNGIVARIARRNHFGRTNGAMSLVNNLGSLAGPVMMGALIDAGGIGMTMAALSAFSIALIALVVKNRSYINTAAIPGTMSTES